MPWLTKVGCNQVQCHGSQYGKGGLKLSMFGADPLFRLRGPRERRQGTADQQDRARQELAASEGHRKHPARRKADRATRLGRIQDAPLLDHSRGAVGRRETAQGRLAESGAGELVLRKDDTHQLTATATFSDGAQKDVTPYAEFKSSDDKIVSVDGGGKLKAEGFGQCSVVAAYMRQSDVAIMVVPQPLAADFPQIAPNNKIDELVFAHLKKLGIPPSESVQDEVFLRRVYLDASGRCPLPTRPGPSLPTPTRKAEQADRSPVGSRGVRRLLGPEVGRPAADQERVPGQPLAEGGADLLPVGPRKHRARTSPTTSLSASCCRPGEAISAAGRPTSSAASPRRTRRPSPRRRPWCSWACGWAAPAATAIRRKTGRWRTTWGMAAFFARSASRTRSEWKEEIVYSIPRVRCATREQGTG